MICLSLGNIFMSCLIIQIQFSSVQSLSRVQLFATSWITAHQASLSINNSRSLPNSCASSRWCHAAISSSVVPFSSCPQSLPASGSFPVSQLFAWGGQSTGVSASASVLPMQLHSTKITWFVLIITHLLNILFKYFFKSALLVLFYVEDWLISSVWFS